MNKTPDTIQQRALETWYYKDHELHQNLLPSVMGISGEAGELLDLVEELGDVLYYVAILAHQLDITLDELSRLNHAKLTAREESGMGYNRGTK
jgi:NTP pyrophosphatase (non-canonical NTP hydrolase)